MAGQLAGCTKQADTELCRQQAPTDPHKQTDYAILFPLILSTRKNRILLCAFGKQGGWKNYNPHSQTDSLEELLYGGPMRCTERSV